MGGKTTKWQSIRRLIDRLAAGAISFFYRLSIARKLMLGFSVLLVLMICISHLQVSCTLPCTST